MEVFSVKLNINSIDYRGSIVDGPGVRTVLFVQECTNIYLVFEFNRRLYLI